MPEWASQRRQSRDNLPDLAAAKPVRFFVQNGKTQVECLCMAKVRPRNSEQCLDHAERLLEEKSSLPLTSFLTDNGVTTPTSTCRIRARRCLFCDDGCAAASTAKSALGPRAKPSNPRLLASISMTRSSFISCIPPIECGALASASWCGPSSNLMCGTRSLCSTC